METEDEIFIKIYYIIDGLEVALFWLLFFLFVQLSILCMQGHRARLLKPRDLVYRRRRALAFAFEVLATQRIVLDEPTAQI